MNAKKLAVLLAGCIAALSIGQAAPAEQNWGQWRGPRADGVAPNGDPPTEWSESKNVKWTFLLPGEGSATPIIWDNFVFVQSAIPVVKKPEAKIHSTPQFAGLPQQPPPGAGPGEPRRPGQPGRGGGGGRAGGGGPPATPFQFTMIALDRTTGKPAWQKILREELPHEGHHGDGSFASASPVTDGETLFAYFGSRGLYAMDLKGSVKWQKDLGDMRTKNSFGEGSSPALFGNTVVVNWDHEGDDFIVAFDKNSGAERWRQKRDEQTSWSTPLIVQHGGVAQVVVNASAKVRSYDLATGKELWSIGPLTANAIPSAVSGNGMIYCMSGFRGAALFAIKPGRTGDLTGSDAIAWTYNKDTPYVPSPLLYDDRLYFVKGNEATLTVLDAKSGQALVEAERLEGVRGVYASPVGAAGRVYLAGRDGGVLVLKKGDKIEVLATNKLNDRFDASPAIAGRELYLRGKRTLYCIAPTERAEAN
ncbi:MAG TPA: PQQ-binding-like beta-propeller repeat protein [Candidatus Limnocylindria bacterium]|nr:PQQ-binding-like beta-propeller repeat protein [Candidatus Limnocylindria bacterium]